LQKRPFTAVDLPVREQEVGDEGKRRWSQPGGNCPRGALHDRRAVLLFDEPLHA
jgi:hypothetical protein